MYFVAKIARLILTIIIDKSEKSRIFVYYAAITEKYQNKFVQNIVKLLFDTITKLLYNH